jgi:hypothetical protein
MNLVPCRVARRTRPVKAMALQWARQVSALQPSSGFFLCGRCLASRVALFLIPIALGDRRHARLGTGSMPAPLTEVAVSTRAIFARWCRIVKAPGSAETIAVRRTGVTHESNLPIPRARL